MITYLLLIYNHFPHKTPRKSRLCKTYCKLNKNKIILVIKEIEGWYLALG